MKNKTIKSSMKFLLYKKNEIIFFLTYIENMISYI